MSPRQSGTLRQRGKFERSKRVETCRYVGFAAACHYLAGDSVSGVQYHVASASASRTYTGQPIPQGALSEFFKQVRSVVAASGLLADQGRLADLETVGVSIASRGGISEHFEWTLDRLFTVTDLSDGNPSSVKFPALPGSYVVEISRPFGVLQLIVVAPTAEEVAAILTLGDRYFPAEPLPAQASPTPSKAAEALKSTRRGQVEEPTRARRLGRALDWMEHLPLYRLLLILGGAVAGLAVVVGAAVWVIRWVGAL